jgi:DNA-binding transcriptional ArsR family regulator
MHEFMAISKALSDENRVRILLALKGGELCVCQIIELLNLAPSTVSKHMLILKHARLVESKKNGRWIYYRMADQNASGAVRDAIDWITRNLSENSQIQKDAEHLENILKSSPMELCQKHKISQP